MTIGEWLRSSTAKLSAAAIDTAHLDSLILLEDVLKQERAHVLAHLDEPLTARQLLFLNRFLKRRLKNEPLAYIRGYCEFYGRKFKVNPSVMVPRPESESFIELIKALASHKSQDLLDIGTGSGILAITTRLEFPFIAVTATDISNKALRVAKFNAKKLRAKVEFYKTDLIHSGTLDKYDFILANLPYIPKNFKVSPGVNFEPAQALYAPQNGLQLIEQLAPLAYQALNSGGYILLESMPNQHPFVKKFYGNAGFSLTATHGLIQCFNKP